MGFSFIAGKHWINLMFNQLCRDFDIGSVLDVGVGSGTYFDSLSPAYPKLKWSGIEIWAPYIETYGLAKKYDPLVVADVAYVDYAKLPSFEVAFFGDILEHMAADTAGNVVSECLNHARFVFISMPVVHFPQGEYDGNPYEKHVEEDWSHEEILSRFPGVRAHMIHGQIGVYLLTLEDAVGGQLAKAGKFVATNLHEAFAANAVK